MELDDFQFLNPIEQLFADDDLDAVKQLEMDFSPRFSEICAQRGSSKCLEYLIEEGHELSSLINLYRIKRGEKPIQEVSHDEELFLVLVMGRDEMLPYTAIESKLSEVCADLMVRCDNSEVPALARGVEDAQSGHIDRPSVRVAFRTLIRLLDNHVYDMVDYTSKIYPLYTPVEWREFIGRCGARQIGALIVHKKYRFLDGARLSNQAMKVIKQISVRKRNLVERYCSLPITYLRKHLRCVGHIHK